MSTPFHPNRDSASGESPSEPPASVIFMEMMRRAADAAATAEADAEAAAFAEAESARQDALQAEAAQAQAERQRELDRRQDAAMEAERLRRVQRRQHQRHQKRAGMLGGFIFTWFIVIVSGGLIATILSWGTSPESLSPELRMEMGRVTGNNRVGLVGAEGGAPLPTSIPTPNYAYRIGIVAGHTGPENDPGAVCEEDGLTEREINFAVAQRVWAQLVDRGYVVDLLEEYDGRLEEYRATLLVSIHSNDCRPYDGTASGFIVAQSDARPSDGPDNRLTECVAQSYDAASPLERRYSITRDMDGYHVFNRIHINTPATIIELGFMYRDREFLTTQTDLMATAIVQGIECFLHPERNLFALTPTPALGQ